MPEYGSPTGNLKFLVNDYESGLPCVEYKSLQEVPEKLKKFHKTYTPSKGPRMGQTFYRVPISSTNAWVNKIVKKLSEYGDEYQIFYTDTDDGCDYAASVRCKDLSGLSLVWAIYTAKSNELRIEFGKYPTVFSKSKQVHPVTNAVYVNENKEVVDNPNFVPYFQKTWNAVVDFEFSEEAQAIKEQAYGEIKKPHKLRVVIPRKSKSFFASYANKLSDIFDKYLDATNKVLGEGIRITPANAFDDPTPKTGTEPLVNMRPSDTAQDSFPTMVNAPVQELQPIEDDLPF